VLSNERLHKAAKFSLPVLAIERLHGRPWGVGNLRSVSLLILNLYNVIVCLVAAVLCIVVNRHKPNRRLASALKIAIVTVAVAAILAHLI
jgi:hypothetical protein